MKKLLFVFFCLGATVLFSGCSPLDWNAKTGLQVIISDGVPAHVLLNGKDVSSTPYINNELKPGEYTVVIKPNDATLANYETNITLKKGLLTVLSWKLGKRPETSGGVLYEMEKLTNGNFSELSITTIPDGSIVQVDDKPQGFSPVLVEKMSPGEHTYEVSLPSYETQKNSIQVVKGYRMNISLKLTKQEYIPSASPAAEVNPLVSTSSSQLSGKTVTATQSSALTSAVPKPKVRIKATGYFEDGKEVLHLRQDPDPSSSSPASVEVGSEYPYLKETLDGWYKISYQNAPVWVSGQYIELIQ